MSAASPTTRWSGWPRCPDLPSSGRHAAPIGSVAGHHCAQILMDRLGVAATARASFAVHTVPEEIDRLLEGLHDARKVFGL